MILNRYVCVFPWQINMCVSNVFVKLFPWKISFCFFSSCFSVIAAIFAVIFGLFCLFRYLKTALCHRYICIAPVIVRRKLTIVTSSIFDILRTNMLTRTTAGPSIFIVCSFIHLRFYCILLARVHGCSQNKQSQSNQGMDSQRRRCRIYVRFFFSFLFGFFFQTYLDFFYILFTQMQEIRQKDKKGEKFEMFAFIVFLFKF